MASLIKIRLMRFLLLVASASVTVQRRRVRVPFFPYKSSRRRFSFRFLERRHIFWAFALIVS